MDMHVEIDSAVTGPKKPTWKKKTGRKTRDGGVLWTSLGEIDPQTLAMLKAMWPDL